MTFTFLDLEKKFTHDGKFSDIRGSGGKAPLKKEAPECPGFFVFYRLQNNRDDVAFAAVDQFRQDSLQADAGSFRNHRQFGVHAVLNDIGQLASEDIRFPNRLRIAFLIAKQIADQFLTLFF